MATLHYSTNLRTDLMIAIETHAGTAPILEMRTGTIPASAGATITGTVLAQMTLPSDWATQASGVLTKSGTWQDAAANATGTAGYWILYKSDGTTVVMMGDITATGGGGAITLDNTSIATNQAVTITTFTITAGNT